MSVAGPRARRLLGVLPDLLAAVAEGAWISVVAALLAAGAGETAVLGPAGFAIGALAGVAGARRLSDRRDWPVLTLALTVAAAVVGWLVDPAVRNALLAGDPSEGIRHNLGGWLAGVALLRGSAHGHAESSRGAMETLLAVALPGLAIPVLIGGALHDPGRAQLYADARLGIVLFLAAATVGVAVARLASLRGPSGFDWRGNRAWLALLVVLVVGVSVVALPVAGVVGPVVQVAIAALFVPALVLGTIVGFRQVSRRAIVVYLVVSTVLIGGLSVLPKVRPAPAPTPSEGAAGAEAVAESTVVYTVVVVAVLALVAAGIVVLARMWARDILARRADDVPEERWIDTGPADASAARPRRRFGGLVRRRPPSDATEAYLAALDALDRSPALRRRPSESPGGHAARVRADGRGTIALDLLAADYELVRFGGVDVTPVEARRAVGRYARIRGLVRRRR